MWYVMQVYTGQEQKVCEQCRSRIMEEGEDVFVLLAEQMTRVRGEWKRITGRLFPGYVLVETGKIEDFFMRLKDMGAMTKVLCTGGEMTPIYPEEEERLRLLGGGEHIVRYSEGYLEGEELTVISGALKGYKGAVKKILRHQRLVVLEMPLMGQGVEVALGLGVVRRG